MHITIKILLIYFTFSLIFNNIYAQEPKNETNSVELEKNGEEITLKSGNSLEDVVDYHAQKITNDFPHRITYLVSEAKVNYKDIGITADYITIHWKTNTVSAYSKIDSLGRIIEKATFTQAGKEYKYESFVYNFKSQKGTVYNGRTQEMDMVIDAQISKRVNDSIYYLRRAIATADEYYKDGKDTLADHFFALNRAKFIDNNALIAGASQFYIEQVPTPLFLPFLYVPLKGERSAGVILPTFGETNELGFYLQGFGFYTPIGEYFDFQVLGDAYTKGSVGTHISSNYKKRYKYSGGFNFDYETRIQGIRGINDGVNAYSKNNYMRINWTHNQDPKSNPNTIFRSTVAFQSSQYYRESINNSNLYNGNVLNNTSNSSISLNKKFDNFPMNFSLTSTLNQNFNTDKANLTLPQINGNLKRLYPFKGKSRFDLFKNFGFDYKFNLMNSVSAQTSQLFTKESFKDGKSGFKNQAGFSTNTSIFDFFPLNFNVNFTEVSQFKYISKYYDATESEVVIDNINRIKSFYTYNFSTGISTNLYGTLLFGKDKMIQGIRHTLQPSVSYFISPDFSSDRFGYYDTYIDGNGESIKYSYFDGGVYGTPSKGFVNSMGFSLNNNLEMKVRSKSDSVDVKKIKIFDYLSFNTAYNFAADSLKMSNIDIAGSTSIWNNKFKLNFRATVNPYKIRYTEGSNTGVLVDKLGYLSLASYSANLNFNLDNAFFGETIDYASIYNTKGRVRYEEYYFDENNYAHFNVPWRMSVGFGYTHSKNLSRTAVEAISLRLSGEISLSPYWHISGQTNYDFVSDNFGYTRLELSRDLRSFIINFSWIPFGVYRSWNFGIYIKANTLRDALKYKDQDYRRSNRPF